MTKMIKATDWDSYYNRPYKTASYARKITGYYLLRSLKELPLKNPKIAELGGGNSAFFDLISKKLEPSSYTIVDNNQVGLDRFKERLEHNQQQLPFPNNLSLINGNILDDHFSAPLGQEFDVVYSVGLIEHFDPQGTAKAINAHLKLVKRGGYIIITYPTPTMLYRLTRSLAELLKMWIFHDERPLHPNEVLSEISKQALILHHFINYPIFLTQGIVIAQKK